MKKLIFLLFLLLIACAPVPTVPPTLTALPPIPTITPSPTATPEPTATPSAPREVEGGEVEIFNNGQWVELNAPEGIWGPVDGSKVVLVDDGEGNQEAYTQMQLENGFRDGADGDDIVNVAKYNPDTKKWELVDEIAIVRSLSEIENLSPKFNDMIRFDDLMIDPKFNKPIDQFRSLAKLLGIKIHNGGKENAELEVGLLYKGAVFKAKLPEVLLDKFVPGEGSSMKPANPKSMSVAEALNLVGGVLGDEPGYPSDNNVFKGAIMAWDVVPVGATVEDCSVGSGFRSPSDLVREWCEAQIQKADRKIPNRSEIDWAILNKVDLLTFEEVVLLENSGQVWSEAPELPGVDGAFFRIIITGI